MKLLAATKYSVSRASLLFLILVAAPYAHANSYDQDRDRPQITIFSATKAGSFYSDDFTLTGRIRGSGIKDAGIYVAGKRLSTLPLNFHHQDPINSRFRITIDASEEPEIRVVTNSGNTFSEKIDILDYRE